MKNYNLRFRVVDRKIFDQIKSGRKSVETRAASVKYQDIEPGDRLIFRYGFERLEKTVKKVSHFKNIEEMFQSIPINSVLPDVQTIAQAKAVYAGFPDYEEKIAQHGLIALEI